MEVTKWGFGVAPFKEKADGRFYGATHRGIYGSNANP